MRGGSKSGPIPSPCELYASSRNRERQASSRVETIAMIDLGAIMYNRFLKFAEDFMLLGFFSLFLSLDTYAQELHVFSNGTIADAEKINENFQLLDEKIKSFEGCSAAQDGDSNLWIPC